MNPEPERRLVVNADDFGLSPGANEAIIRAHREGILTSASLMVNEAGTAEAVALAREHPTLGVGLHLTLLCGHCALPPARVPGLADANGRFGTNSVAAGVKYFFQRKLRGQLREEIHEQFRRFRETGLPLDHINGHLHFHLHPAVFDILMRDAEELGIRRMRLTRDSLRTSLRCGSGRLFYRVSHAVIFQGLAARSRRDLARRGIRHTGRVFGLLENARVEEEYVLKLLPLLPAGDSELYSHPSTDVFKSEFQALVSPRVREAVTRLGIRLVRYADL